MKISFDFDGVLDTAPGVEFLEALAHANRLCGLNGTPFQLYIVTTRTEGEDDYQQNADIWNLTFTVRGDLRIKYTNGEWKWKTLEEMEVDIHIDDNPDEVTLINEKCSKCQGLLFGANIHNILLEGTEL